MAYAPEEAAILSRYVSNLDRNVYTISNLPEEVIAVIFAFVSRSPRSFRDNLLSLIHDRELALSEVEEHGSAGAGFDVEKAHKFHEKWVVGYGHASVAELAVAHVGVEKISRLASARLELSNPFLSFIEYSQRYQRPARGQYFTPPALGEHPDLLAEYHRLQDLTYDAYAQLFQGLVPYVRETLKPRPKETDKGFATRVDKTAFEDARYALTLAVHTNLGITGNGRALRDSIVRLLADQYPECRELARSLKEEVGHVLPVLLKYADPSSYWSGTQEALRSALGRLRAGGAAGARPAEVRLRDWTGRGALPQLPPEVQRNWDFMNPAEQEEALADAATGDGSPEEAAALAAVLEGLLATYGGLDGDGVRQALAAYSHGEMVALFQEAVERLGPHDHPLDALQRVTYDVEFHVSEACWHQLLRHCRKIQFNPQDPSIRGGWVVPPNVAAAGLAPVLEAAVLACEELYGRFATQLPLVAPYVVTNAHRRGTLARLDLWELYHLVQLRGGRDAQWEIREAILDLNAQVARVHPNLAPAPRRSATA